MVLFESGIEFCKIGFLSSQMLPHAVIFDGEMAQMVQMHEPDNINKFIRKKEMTMRGYIQVEMLMVMSSSGSTCYLRQCIEPEYKNKAIQE